MPRLYLIPTPIGNLEDITLRALRILKEVDIVLAEDTRITKKLLSHYKIETVLASFHMHNEHKVLQKWINDLKAGKRIALVSDAGTPSISDPGFLLARECIKEAINYSKPLFIRFGKKPMLKIHNDKDTFKIGKGVKIREGKDILFVTTGETAQRVFLASEILQKKNKLTFLK